MGGDENPQPLQISHVDQPIATINRLQILVHSSALLAVIYYRASRLQYLLYLHPWSPATLSWLLLFLADLLLAFLWTLAQPFRLRPVTRTVFPERLPEDGSLPPIDVFIVTADPEKEPAVDVMNTVLSAMALDYPADKLHVYISDDGGSPITLFATKRAYSFAEKWVPFCKRNNVEVRRAETYFSNEGSNEGSNDSMEFLEERRRIKLEYDNFKESIKKAVDNARNTNGLTGKGKDRLPYIEIMKDEEQRMTELEKQPQIPPLIYISREKKKSYSHQFKAGALNVLLRISSIISNSPYILVLDCDMYCNNPISARQAMCFHLDAQVSPSLAFVQFPQAFHNISKNDIYSSGLRTYFKILWKGMDGFRGPVLSGTGFYIKRDALYGAEPGHASIREEFNSVGISALKQIFGSSNEFIVSLREKRSNNATRTKAYSLLQEAIRLASCSYENDTQWGHQVGFLYDSVVEDYFTGFHLHCRGWLSTYLCPSKPAFLGTVPINYSDTLVQSKRWAAGLLGVGLSKYCPLTFGISSRINSVLQCMCYAWLALLQLFPFALFWYGIIPQLCLLNGIPLFPKVSSPWFAAFVIVYASSISQHIMEVIISGQSLKAWWNEQRHWLIIAVTSQFFACVNVIMKLVGVREVDFELTNKAIDEDQLKRYENEQFDFQGASSMILPATTLSLLNMATLIRGGWRMIMENSFDELFAQLFISCYILALSYPLLEGILFRRDNGRIPTRISLWSIAIAIVLSCLIGQ